MTTPHLVEPPSLSGGSQARSVHRSPASAENRRGGEGNDVALTSTASVAGPVPLELKAPTAYQ